MCLRGTNGVLRKQESTFQDADLVRNNLDNTRSRTFWEKNQCLSCDVQWPFGMEFGELLAYITTWTTQDHVIFTSAINPSKYLNLQRSVII